jgi:hypothetical protein
MPSTNLRAPLPDLLAYFGAWVHHLPLAQGHGAVAAQNSILEIPMCVQVEIDPGFPAAVSFFAAMAQKSTGVFSNRCLSAGGGVLNKTDVIPSQSVTSLNHVGHF